MVDSFLRIFMHPCSARSGSSRASFFIFSLLFGTFFAAAAAVPVRDARAQTTANVFDQIFGNSSRPGQRARSNDRSNAKRSRSRRKPPNDLRPNKVPWRSDEMVAATQAAIERYKRIVRRGGWRPVKNTRILRVGDSDDRVRWVRERLRATGDLRQRREEYYGTTTFDDELKAGVMRFQRRHGLRVTGRIQRRTFAAMNVSAKKRLEQLELNLKKLMDLTRERIEDRYILVNVPAFQLEAVEKYEVEQRHRVIAGRPTRETPVIKATITGVNFFPYWHVPISIAQKDIVPRLAKEPGYLRKEGIRVVDGYNGPEINATQIDWDQVDLNKVKFRQDPGKKNALGLVRIDMWNEHNVYMHDTPMQSLFNSSQRAFSAGCVRVQGVYELVEWINKYELGWEEPGRVQQVLESGNPLDLKLTRPVPVYFTYITGWGEPGGAVQFRADIYNLDDRTVVAKQQLPADPQDAPDVPENAAVLAP